jgi:hypothetical protein
LVNILLRLLPRLLLERRPYTRSVLGGREMVVWARESRWKVILTSEELLHVGDRCGNEIAPPLPLVVVDSNYQGVLRARAAVGRNVVLGGHHGGEGGEEVDCPVPKLHTCCVS